MDSTIRVHDNLLVATEGIVSKIARFDQFRSRNVVRSERRVTAQVQEPKIHFAGNLALRLFGDVPILV